MTTSVQNPATIKSMVKFVTFADMIGYQEVLPTIRVTTNGYLQLLLCKPVNPVLNEHGKVTNEFFGILFSKNALQDERISLGANVPISLLKDLYVVNISEDDEKPHYKLCFKQERIDLSLLKE